MNEPQHRNTQTMECGIISAPKLITQHQHTRKNIGQLFCCYGIWQIILRHKAAKNQCDSGAVQEEKHCFGLPLVFFLFFTSFPWSHFYAQGMRHAPLDSQSHSILITHKSSLYQKERGDRERAREIRRYEMYGQEKVGTYTLCFQKKKKKYR